MELGVCKGVAAIGNLREGRKGSLLGRAQSHSGAGDTGEAATGGLGPAGGAAGPLVAFKSPVGDSAGHHRPLSPGVAKSEKKIRRARGLFE